MANRVGGIQFDSFGYSVTPRNDKKVNALAFNNLTSTPVTSLHGLSLRERTNLPTIPSQRSLNNDARSNKSGLTISE